MREGGGKKTKKRREGEGREYLGDLLGRLRTGDSGSIGILRDRPNTHGGGRGGRRGSGSGSRSRSGRGEGPI